jgi:hypothetical protein
MSELVHDRMPPAPLLLYRLKWRSNSCQKDESRCYLHTLYVLCEIHAASHLDNAAADDWTSNPTI